jgi:decaprenyl-phosphate phosphoribosyltransferase
MKAIEILKAMRPHQWVKNLFVVAPLVFAERASELQNLIDIGLAFGLFCLFSGCVYILNDLMDVEQDRVHPVKKKRPIASGRLPVKTAWVALVVILAGASAGAFALSVALGGIGCAYFALNVAYSMALKHVPFVDVSIIAAGFVLRIYGGAAAIDVPLSIWLIGCTFLLAAFLGLGKRKHELLTSGDGASKQRKVLRYYRLEAVRLAMIVSAVATASCYTAYVLAGETLQAFEPIDLFATIPCVVLGLWRFSRLTERHGEGRSPTDLMLLDKAFVLNLLCWSAIVIFVIYGG